MFSHVYLGTNDVAKARSFYDAAMGALGYERDPGQQDLYLEEIPRAIAAYPTLIESEANGTAAGGSPAPVSAGAAVAAP